MTPNQTLTLSSLIHQRETEACQAILNALRYLPESEARDRIASDVSQILYPSG